MSQKPKQRSEAEAVLNLFVKQASFSPMRDNSLDTFLNAMASTKKENSEAKYLA